MADTTKEVRPKLDPETCAVCGRRLLQGESVNWFVTPDSSRRAVCELCAPRADRARWIREREGEEIVQLRPAHVARTGIFRRALTFLTAPEADDGDDLTPIGGGSGGDQGSRRQARAARRLKSSPIESRPRSPVQPQRNVQAVPVGAGSRLEQGIQLFNSSQFPRAIAGLNRSLGSPQVAVRIDADDGACVQIFVCWEIAWYSYRVDLGDATEPVEQSGRGNDATELPDAVKSWNGFADEYGRLYMPGPPLDPQDSTDQKIPDDGETVVDASDPIDLDHNQSA